MCRPGRGRSWIAEREQEVQRGGRASGREGGRRGTDSSSSSDAMPAVCARMGGKGWCGSACGSSSLRTTAWAGRPAIVKGGMREKREGRESCCAQIPRLACYSGVTRCYGLLHGQLTRPPRADASTHGLPISPSLSLFLPTLFHSHNGRLRRSVSTCHSAPTRPLS